MKFEKPLMWQTKVQSEALASVNSLFSKCIMYLIYCNQLYTSKFAVVIQTRIKCFLTLRAVIANSGFTLQLLGETEGILVPKLHQRPIK